MPTKALWGERMRITTVLSHSNGERLLHHTNQVQVVFSECIDVLLECHQMTMILNTHLLDLTLALAKRFIIAIYQVRVSAILKIEQT